MMREYWSVVVFLLKILCAYIFARLYMDTFISFLEKMWTYNWFRWSVFICGIILIYITIRTWFIMCDLTQNIVFISDKLHWKLRFSFFLIESELKELKKEIIEYDRNIKIKVLEDNQIEKLEWEKYLVTKNKKKCRRH